MEEPVVEERWCQTGVGMRLAQTVHTERKLQPFRVSGEGLSKALDRFLRVEGTPSCPCLLPIRHQKY